MIQFTPIPENITIKRKKSKKKKTLEKKNIKNMSSY